MGSREITAVSTRPHFQHSNLLRSMPDGPPASSPDNSIRFCWQSGQRGRLMAATCAEATGRCSGMTHPGLPWKRFRPRSQTQEDGPHPRMVFRTTRFMVKIAHLTKFEEVHEYPSRRSLPPPSKWFLIDRGSGFAKPRRILRSRPYSASQIFEPPVVAAPVEQPRSEQPRFSDAKRAARAANSWHPVPGNICGRRIPPPQNPRN